MSTVRAHRYKTRGHREALHVVAVGTTVTSTVGTPMVRCQCCDQLVETLTEVPTTKQRVCARCFRLIAGMMGVWDAIASAIRQKKPCDA
jgi:hypothetical protein